MTVQGGSEADQRERDNAVHEAYSRKALTGSHDDLQKELLDTGLRIGCPAHLQPVVQKSVWLYDSPGIIHDSFLAHEQLLFEAVDVKGSLKWSCSAVWRKP